MKKIWITCFGVILTLSIQAYDFKVDGIFYTIISGNEVEVTFETNSNNKYSGHIVLPASITHELDTYTVTSIAENAFYNCPELRSVIIPASVNKIGILAFAGNSNLTFVNILATSPPALGSNVFKNSSVPYILVPTGCKTNYKNWESAYKIAEDGPLIEIHNATAGQLSQTLISAGYSPLSGIVRLRVSGYMNDVDFSQIKANFSGLISLDLSNVVVTDQILPSGTFSGKTLLYSFKMPQNLNTIGSGAFSGCTSLQDSLRLPHGITTIGSGAFQSCKLIPGNLILPNTLTMIGIYAFSGCTRLNGSLEIPPLVTQIPSYCFANCTGLDGTLTMSGPVTTIGEAAFLDCFRLRGSLYLPNTVISTANLAFSGCKGFNGELHISSSMKTIGSASFKNCSGFAGNLVIPDSVTDIGNFSFSGCTGFNGNLMLSNSMTSIGSESFLNCSNLTGSLTIPSSVTTIAGHAFEGCSKLTGSLIIPDRVTDIWSSAFAGCTGFNESLYLSDKLTTIGGNVFSGCNQLKGILRIPQQVTTVELNAFKDCAGFSELQIGKNVATLGDYAFGGCTGIRKIAVARTVPPSVSANTFNGISNESCRIVVPTGSSHTYQTRNIWSGFIFYSESDDPLSATPETVFEKILIYKVPGGLILEGFTIDEEVALYDLKGILLKKERSTGGSMFVPVITESVVLVKVSEKVFKLVGTIDQ